MNKKLICLLLLVIGNFIFADEISNGNTKKTVIRAGIKAFAKPSLYLKANKGAVFFKYGSKIEELKENEFIKIELKNNKIIYSGKNADEILTAKGSIQSIISLSVDGKNYRKYRGDFRFIARE